MKKSLLILAITLISFSNSSNANTVNLPYNLFQNSFYLDNNERIENHDSKKFDKPSLAVDVEVFDPETVIASSPKTVKDIIAEGDKIVEKTISEDVEFIKYEEFMKQIIAQSDLIIENAVSNETYPLYAERTIEDEIAELELIIESTKTNEASPLDFKKINSNSILNNSTFNTKTFIGMN
ncbi:hypothetical protein [Flavobacterium aestuarii]|uniref:hypothetical protein n=1 Tax=Flavobacterium aestuarii TaxID=3149227 RepID=UPI0032B33B4A